MRLTMPLAALALALALAGCGSPDQSASRRPLASIPAGTTTPAAAVPAVPAGALNPQVSQATAALTICVTGWTARVRPRLETRPGYQHDHVIPLELGGAPSDPANLWFEPLAQARVHDRWETLLKRLVCARALSLADAQRLIWSVKAADTLSKER